MGHRALKGAVCHRPSILGTSELNVLRALKILRILKVPKSVISESSHHL